MAAYARRKDSNQSAMESELRQLHFHVADTSRLGGGFPDMIVTGYCPRKRCVMALLVEVKMPKGKLTPDEAGFYFDYPVDGPLITAYSTEDVLEWFDAMDGWRE